MIRRSAMYQIPCRSVILSLSLLLMSSCSAPNLSAEQSPPDLSTSTPSTPAETSLDTPDSTPTLTDDLAALAQNLPITAQAEIGATVIQLEVANTPQQQALGLMFRSELAADQGMLFPFTTPRPVQFWMKNVFIHLDMVFLRDGLVQAIEADVPPCVEEPCPTYGPRDVVIDQVIELRGGRAAELGLAVGDRIEILAAE
ncbi:MAG: DUF192 domain-containing protein [Cyanobacteria bacterium P01_A01_bin.123]